MKKLLKNSLPFIPAENLKLNTWWIKPEFADKNGDITLITAGPRVVETSIQAVRAKASDIGKLNARRFVDLLRLGHRPGEAAHMMHTTVQTLMENPDTKKMVQQLADKYTLDAKTTKLVVRALRNKIMLENADKDPKLALEAAKQAAEDPDVGLSRGAQPVAQIDLQFQTLINAPVEPIASLKAIMPPAGEVIDVTPDDKSKD